MGHDPICCLADSISSVSCGCDRVRVWAAFRTSLTERATPLLRARRRKGDGFSGVLVVNGFGLEVSTLGLKWSGFLDLKGIDCEVSEELIVGRERERERGGRERFVRVKFVRRR